MRRSLSFLLVLFAAFCLLGQAETAHAAITPTGDGVPDGPTTWNSTTTGYVGQTAAGSLRVNSSSDQEA